MISNEPLWVKAAETYEPISELALNPIYLGLIER